MDKNLTKVNKYETRRDLVLKLLDEGYTLRIDKVKNDELNSYDYYVVVSEFPIAPTI